MFTGKWRLPLLAAMAFCLLLAFSARAEAFTLISTSQELEIGKQAAAELEKKFGLVDDRALQDRVQRIGARIGEVSDRRTLTYTVKVLNIKDVNAIALPGGYLYLFKGLVDHMPSDDELAGIIGHEIGHIAKRHAIRQMEKNLMTAAIFGVAFGGNAMPLQQMAMMATAANYSRADEREADRLGFVYTTRAGFNPYSMLLGLMKLNELDHPPGWGLFSSHPEPESRVELLHKHLKEAKVRPVVALKNGETWVTDGAWRLPAAKTAEPGYKPLYQAYFVAGNLHLAASAPGFNRNGFVPDSDGTNVSIYYEDRRIVRLTPEEAAAHGQELNDFASRYIEKIREWVPARPN